MSEQRAEKIESAATAPVGGVRQAFPERTHPIARSGFAVDCIADTERRSVDGAGARSGNALDVEPAVLHQEIEHTPRVRAERRAALQSEAHDASVERLLLAER